MKSLFTIIISLLAALAPACKKGGNNRTPADNPGGSIPVPPADPTVENTIGFFLQSWTPKNFTPPAEYTPISLPTTAPDARVRVDAATVITKIPPTVFGHNANSWMTQIITEPVLMSHLKNLKPALKRFPGGSISDLYFWNALPGQPPADAPNQLRDENGTDHDAGYWYGKNPDSWTISVDNYYRLLKQTGSEGLITVNYGYARYGTSPNPVAAAAHLAANWVRYDNGRTRYWEIGNECNGTWEAGYRINTATNRDGQPEIISGALYGRHVQVFIDSMRQAAQEIGKTIYIGAYLLEKEPEAWQTTTDKNWNSGLLASVANKPDYYVIHSYYTPYQTNATADAILASATDNTAAMMRYVKQSFAQNGAVVKPVALDEWNIFSEGSQQQVSYVNGMHAAILLGEAIRNKYGQTSRWDLANGWNEGNDHGMFNIGDEPGSSKWNPRPAFYYLYYMQKMMGDRLLASQLVSGNGVLCYASSFSSGEKGVMLVNKSNRAQVVQVSVEGATTGSRMYGYTLTGGTDNGEFSRQVFVNGLGPAGAAGGPANYAAVRPYSAVLHGPVGVNMPARSVAYLVIED